VHVLGDIEVRHVEMTYLPTGEPLSITRRRGADTYTRTMQYDSLGRMTVNLEPTGGANGWRYLYDQAGDLVATSDPRGCGVNFAYDRGGRLLSEDYSPCGSYQGDDHTSLAEVVYEYDDWVEPTAFSDASDPSFVPGQDCRLTNYTLGRLVAVTDRAQRSITCYDGRGRTVEVAKQLKDPSGNLAGRWYDRRAKYDGVDRPKIESTGAQLLVGGQISQVETSYTERGKVDQVTSSYGMLVDHVTRDADGLVKEIQYGDAADTTTGFTYDDLRRLRNLTTFRSNQSGWTNGEHTQQMLLQDEQFTYDRVGNPVEVRDWRDPEEWPTGAKPVTRKLQYDDLYRLSRIDYQQVGGEDAWIDPYAAEVLDNERPQPSPRADFSDGGKRVQWQTYAYDWLGNTTTTDDDQHAFYDRSLGTVTNDEPTNRYQLKEARVTQGSRHGELAAQYDDAGNLLTMDVGRDGKCVPVAKCPGDRLDQHFEYQWDEVGRLTRAKRWDKTVPDGTADADLSFTYDASDQRVRKTSGSSHTLYVFGSLELRRAAYEAGDYVLSEATEVPYLFANGVRLGRVVHVQEPLDGVHTRVFLELGDHLGSTSVVLDRASGELVQRSTAYAYGEVESSLRPGRWEEFREDYRFTGKEDDVEVGLIYFGKRFYAPLLQRWLSPDPLAIHAPGQADLNLYAYVHGKVLVAVDPVGLCDADGTQSCMPVQSNEGGSTGYADGTTPVPQSTVSSSTSTREQSTPAPGGGPGWQNYQKNGGDYDPLADVQAGYEPFGGGRLPGTRSDPSTADKMAASATAGFVPGAGELMDADVLADPNASQFARGVAGASLFANALTAGLLPNLGGAARQADDVVEGAIHSSDEILTFFRGTTYGDALEVVDNQAISAERILVNQAAAPPASGPGAYLTKQLGTAEYFANLAGQDGRRGLGDAVLRIDVPRAQFEEFAVRCNICVDAPMPQPPLPNMTETLIPFEHLPELNSMATFSVF
jgi:RHS repeat-associated protein